VTGQFHPTPLSLTKKGQSRGYPLRACLECKEQFYPWKMDQVYCPGPCKDKAKNREMLRARAIYRAAYHWVTCPVAERGTFATLMGNVARQWRDEDRELGRDAPPLPTGYQEVQAVSKINAGRTLANRARAKQ
jgi:hypothetical protein